MTELTRSQWSTLLDRVGKPATFGEVVAAIEDADMVDADAEQLVDSAISTGEVVENPDAGMFGAIELPDADELTNETDEDTEPAKPEVLNAEEPESPATNPGGSTTETPDHVGRWDELDYSATDADVYPDPHHEETQWMGRLAGEKMPFSPWADKDHPEADAEDDARYKWGLRSNYTDGDTVAVAEDDPRLDGRVFIQREDDPYAFVDGDDVRCPETGEVHPAFKAILQQLGMTYADVSTSGSGLHAYYVGELPIDGKGQATFDIDTEPWGENDSPPAVEIYANKHVCVATGDHVIGTPTTATEWDDDALRSILIANGYEDQQPIEHDTDHDSLDDYEPTTTSATETAEDMRDVYAAVDRLAPRDLPLSTARTGEDSTGWSTWNPSYRSSDSGQSLHYNGEGAFHDHKEGEAFGVLSLFAAEEGVLTNPWDRLAGSDFFEAIEAAREAGAPIPEPPEPDQGETEAALPLARLDALDREEARRYARKHGVKWPTTREAREELRNRIVETMYQSDMKVVDAPTALGKSYTVATEPWLRRSDITGDAPVIQFHETREARDQAAQASEEGGVQHATLLGRSEACPVAAGGHDPVEDGEGPDQIITMGGMAASEWFKAVCEGRGLPFSVAHQYLDEHNDQGVDLPCCAEDGQECPAISQWNGLPKTEEGDVAVDVIHATHGFAHVPSLRNGTNMIFDERPDFRADLSHQRVRRAVAAFLKEAEAPVDDFERFVARARNGDETPNEHAKHSYISEALDHEPSREWYLEADGAHTLAPALTKAIYRALRPEDDEVDASDTNGRYSATVPHEPPRLDAEASEEEGWNRVWVRVTLDENNTVRVVRSAPDMSAARSIVGLDAHPTTELWQQNVHPSIRTVGVLDAEKRRLWRRFERGLSVVQVGEATRPLTSGEYFDEDGTEAFLRALRDKYGSRFSTAITAASVEHRTEELLREAGVQEPRTMHYGEEKSRGDFGDEDVGALNGCIDPGDDYVLDLLAEADLDATPETSVDSEGETHRAKGRGFEGPDADAAERLLASVRENHVAQAAGRYARNADDPDDTAVVYVRTDALPFGFADLTVPGVEWLPSERQREVIAELRERPHATTAELAEAVGVTKEHARKTLARLREADLVQRQEGAGKHGADLYRALAGLGDGSMVEMTRDQTANDDVCGSYTWALAISTPDTTETPATTPADPAALAERARPSTQQAALPAESDGDPPE